MISDRDMVGLPLEGLVFVLSQLHRGLLLLFLDLAKPRGLLLVQDFSGN